MDMVYLQEAQIIRSRFGGVVLYDAPDSEFEMQIKGRAERRGDLSECVFGGGMDSGRIERIARKFAGRDADIFRSCMRKHAGEAKRGLDSAEESMRQGIITDSYSRADAEKWAAEYKEAMQGIVRGKE